MSFASPPVGSGLPETHAERAPMAAANGDRRRDVFHQYEIAAAHVAPVSLQQKRFCICRHLFYRTIVEQPFVPAIGVVPDEIRPLRQAIVRIMGREVAALGPRDAEHYAWVAFLDGILN